VQPGRRRVEHLAARRIRAQPALRGHVQAVLGGVDGLAARHQRVGVDRREHRAPAAHVDRQHGQRAEAGERLRPPHLPAAHERPALPLAGAPLAQHRSRQPRRRPRPPDRAPPAPPQLADRRARVRRHVQPARLGGDHDPRGLAGEAAVHVAALDVERAQHPRRRRVRDVDLEQPRAAQPLGRRGDDALRRGRHRHVAEPEPRDHEQLVPAQQQVAAVAGQVERAQQAWRRAARVDDPQLVAGDHVHAAACRLDPVGLVDAGLLDVGRRRARAVLAAATAAGRRRLPAGLVLPACHRGRRAAGPTAGPALHDQRVGDHPYAMALRVAEQVRAGAERVQPRALLPRLRGDALGPEREHSRQDHDGHSHQEPAS
jgi:hypothetical protein